MKKIIVFPGQGAQKIEMGKDICENFSYANEMAEKANEILGFDLKSLCFEGPQEELSKTKNCQAAIFLTSALFFEVLKKEKGLSGIEGVAGLSLGEYTALYAAESISFEDALCLVRRRGELMQEAGEKNPGTMASVLGFENQQVIDICEKVDGYVVAANMNCPGQVVISGEIEAIDDACEIVKEYKGKAIKLAVSGAFHSKLMDFAAEGLKEALENVDIKAPKYKFTANVSGQFVDNPQDIREGLIAQLTGNVLWQKCIETWLAQGESRLIEVGPNRILAGLMRKINRSQAFESINSLDAVNGFQN